MPRRIVLLSIEMHASAFGRYVANEKVACSLLFGSRSGIGRSRWAGAPLLEAAAPCREGAGYATHHHLRDPHQNGRG